MIIDQPKSGTSVVEITKNKIDFTNFQANSVFVCDDNENTCDQMHQNLASATKDILFNYFNDILNIDVSECGYLDFLE
jgi:hypothetical protein